MTADSGHQREIHNVQHPLKTDMPEAGEGDPQPREQLIETDPGMTEMMESVTRTLKELV